MLYKSTHTADYFYVKLDSDFKF